MSPFSTVLHELRSAYGLRQSELAAMLGYEQSYISALEIGIKGPPPPEFVNRLIADLNLDEDWQSRLRDSIESSQRKILLPSEAPEAVFRLCNELRKQIANLHPTQIELMRIALRLPLASDVEALPSRQRMRRRKAIRKEVAEM